MRVIRGTNYVTDATSNSAGDAGRVCLTVSGPILYSSRGFRALRGSCLPERISTPAHLVICLVDAAH